LFENPDAAKHVLETFLSINGQMDEAIVAIQTKSTPEEYARFKKAVGYVMYEVFDKIIEPICKRHPPLRPPGMEG